MSDLATDAYLHGSPGNAKSVLTSTNRARQACLTGRQKRTGRARKEQLFLAQVIFFCRTGPKFQRKGGFKAARAER